MGVLGIESCGLGVCGLGGALPLTGVRAGEDRVQ